MSDPSTPLHWRNVATLLEIVSCDPHDGEAWSLLRDLLPSLVGTELSTIAATLCMRHSTAVRELSHFQDGELSGT